MSASIIDSRLATIFSDLATAIEGIVRRHAVTHAEYRQAVAFLDELGRAGEIALFLDVFVEHRIIDANFAGRDGTSAVAQGPFYVEGAPFLQPPYELPHRPDEPGDVLILSGRVRAPDGSPLAGVMLDVWQADATGIYSNFFPGAPEYNLRGRFQTGTDGGYEVRTVVPAPYEIPKAGPTGRFVAAMGRHAFRPAHLHLKLSHGDYRPLTTQLYFAGDPWLDSDVADSVKDSLVVRLQRHQDPADLDKRGVDRPYFSAQYDFVLAPVREPAAAGR